jgi:hypothetical protein
VHAYYADLVVVARPDPAGQTAGPPGLAESLVLTSGRPIIMFPPGSRVSRVRRILVGWNSVVVLTCTQCLRSFPFTVDHEPTGEVLKTPCIYCPHEVTYIINFSRSVNSPEKRVAWKAASLKSQKESAAAGNRRDGAA